MELNFSMQKKIVVIDITFIRACETLTETKLWMVGIMWQWVLFFSNGNSSVKGKATSKMATSQLKVMIMLKTKVAENLLY